MQSPPTLYAMGDKMYVMMINSEGQQELVPVEGMGTGGELTTEGQPYLMLEDLDMGEGTNRGL